ncbi:MAG TPA: nucleoside deaminase [Pyrinomonadaceae bacterium]|nr:nucleoside deaminase [Pyrinomonadaceae bacterium]
MVTSEADKTFMERAIELAREGAGRNAGGPFGCVIVKGGRIVGEGCNQVTSTNDPTAHAEIVAIREACRNLGSFQLDECVVYTSCEPCPMCLGAIYWARPDGVFFAGTREDAAAAGFDDELFYDELEKPNDERQLKMVNLLREGAQKVFNEWTEKPDKTEY